MKENNVYKIILKCKNTIFTWDVIAILKLLTLFFNTILNISTENKLRETSTMWEHIDFHRLGFQKMHLIVVKISIFSRNFNLIGGCGN